jgi:hypothetical protein
MKFVKIKAGPFKGRVGQVIKEEGEDITVKIAGEPEPQKIKIDWLKVLSWAGRIIKFIISLIEDRKTKGL